MSDNNSAEICPDCDSDHVQASENETTCLDCGATFNSGIQKLAGRFSL